MDGTQRVQRTSCSSSIRSSRYVGGFPFNFSSSAAAALAAAAAVVVGVAAAAAARQQFEHHMTFCFVGTIVINPL